MFKERVCWPNEHISFMPLTIGMPVLGGFIIISVDGLDVCMFLGAEHVNLSFSGLDQSQACWI